MILTTSNPDKQLLCLSYFGVVTAEEVQQSERDVKALLAAIKPDFQLLVDLSELESIKLDCVPHIGRVMDYMDQHGVKLVVRVIADPKQDFGLNIMSLFHYKRHPKIITCETALEALGKLSL